MATISIPHRWKYDVFVSFRGEDIRKNFMDHMFNDFKQKGIHAFRDDTQLPKGEEISPHLYKAIEESRFLIVIFSKNYASSSWCLRELVKILGKPEHEVQIIFYDVKPNVVRNQTDSYAEAFAKHQVSNSTKVDEWKKALSKAADLSGWELQDMTNGYEYKFIDSISRDILKNLCVGPLHVDKNLVGIDFHFNKLNLSRFVGSDKVNMIGICGMSGIGKTTLAKAIYNLMYVHFEGSCFCEDVKEVEEKQGLTHVQMQMIGKILKTDDLKISSVGEGSMIIKRSMACKRMLLVLDDVNKAKQLEALAGPDWFSRGSLIIFTGQDKHLLGSHGVDRIYEMESLDYYEALELFSLNAFGERRPTDDFVEFASQIVEYLHGHPLALKVIGRSLNKKSVEFWEGELKRRQTYPNPDIQQKLLPSFDGLAYDEKRMFLDIACAFIGEKKDFAASVLNSSNYFPNVIEVLVDKFLITVSPSNMSLQMHELIQCMAKEIIREEFSMPGNHSRRLWISSEDDILNVNKVAEEVEVLVLLLKKNCQNIPIDGQALTRMKNLRILKICFPKVEGRWQPFSVNFSGRLDLLSNKLRLLYWHGLPLESLPSDFYPENIVAIDLSYSHIKQLWTTPKYLRRLKVMKLRHCCNLTTTPDFSDITNLEELDLDGCVNLVTVHPSIGMLKRLVVLNMRDCRRAVSFPSKVETDSLQVLNRSGCLNGSLKPFGLDAGLKSLVIWNQQHPQRSVSLTGCHMLKSLNFSFCNLVQVPESIEGLSCLKYLCLEGNNFTSLPGSLSQLSHLGTLDLDGCKKLEVLPELPHSVEYIYASDCTSLCSVTGSNPVMSRRLTYLNNCPKLFENLAIDSQVSISETECRDSSVTSQGSTNRFSSFLRYAHNRCGLFHLPGSSIMNMDIYYHGNSIPNWFTNKSMGNQVKVESPSDWSFSKLRGYGICVVFKRKKPSASFLGYSVKNFDGANLGGCGPYFYWVYFEDKPIRIDESDMLWLHYTTSEIDKWKKAKNFVTFYFDEREEIEVKECGARVVCDEDSEAADLSMFQDLPTLSEHGGAMCVFGKYGEYGKIDWTW